MMNAPVSFPDKLGRGAFRDKADSSSARMKEIDPMKVLSVTSELYPLIKTGGLADVTGSLPKALSSCGVQTTTMLPGYPVVLNAVQDRVPLLTFENLLGERATLYQAEHKSLDLLILDCPALYNRDGGPYIDAAGQDHHDNWLRFAVLSRAAAEVANGALSAWQPDLVHTHDWQTALTSVYMREAGCDVPVVLTIHNLAFQGQYGADRLASLDLPHHLFSTDCLEYFGDISYLKGGIQTADAITTVSPTYAREILTNRFGMGLDGVLNQRVMALRGIVNGIDMDVWNPATDPFLPRNFDSGSMRRKRENRAPLLERFELEQGDGPIFSAVTRLTWQKGMDMFAEAADEVLHQGGRVIVFGQGDHEIEQILKRTATRFPRRMSVHTGYDEPTAHLIQGGSDAIVQPSRFEPCGLTQLYALRYGCVPVVSRTGGLSETIIDANDAAMSARVATGFQFHPVNTDGLRLALRRALDTYGDTRNWARLQHQGMKTHFSWERSAEKYAAIYNNLLMRKSEQADEHRYR